MVRQYLNNFTTKILKQRDTKNERGNVLFLILIAVALFAALSYAVTSSSRSGGGDASSETNLVSSASITQYPAAIRTTLIRMIISGVTADQLAFNVPPYDYTDPAGDTADLDTNEEDLEPAVFHPSGGGAVYSPASRDIMTSSNPDGHWYFNGNFEIEDVATTGTGGNEIIAFLPGISKGVCEKINLQLGIVKKSDTDLAPDADADWSDDYRANMLDADDDADTAPTNYPASAADVIDDGSTPNIFAGEPFGCFENTTDNEYVYYHVLIEQ